MLFYNFEKLDKLAQGDLTYAFSLLETFIIKRKPILYPSKKYNIDLNLSGKSWLLNPTALLSCTVEDAYKYQYLILASKRDYTLYLTYKLTSLPISYFPDLDLDKIRFNPLLRVQDNNIHFKYER
jgi:hypothetical protein